MDTAKKRRGFTILKVLIYIEALIVLTLCIYVGINYIAYDNSVQNEEESESVDETESELDGMSKADTSNRIAVIVGTATVLMAVLTMLQQHINRRQDRALAFPKMALTECQFVIGNDNVIKQTFFYNGTEGKLLIKLLFQDTISHCYVSDIYRVAVARHPYQKKMEEYTYLNVLKSFSGFGENGFYMEAIVETSNIVEKFCKSQQGTYTNKLDIAMDVAWRNGLYRWGFRNMWSMYLRYKIRLNDLGRQTININEGLYGYNVESVSLEEAPW